MTERKQFSLFLLFWFLLNLFTAAFTELYSDESYYWVYSKFLDWGYFDHPPMVAFFIKMGSWLGKNELAVRLFTVILSTASIGILYTMVKPKSAFLFSLTIFGFLTMHILGFVTMPDTPFFFFSLVFLLAYKRFLEDESFINQLLMALSAALMMYSKYHGGLMIVLLILSNLKLLCNYRFYAVGAMALLIFSPHIIWQISNDYPSFRYHFTNIGESHYKFKYTLDFVSGNLPAMGGFVAVVFFIASFKYKSTNLWEKALKWNLYGTMLFFLITTFKANYVEPNWTLFCMIPVIYFGYRQLENTKRQMAFKGMLYFSAALMLLYRVHLVFPLVVIKKDRIWDFHHMKSFAEKVDAMADNRLIVSNSYQDASLLDFYSHSNVTVPAININGRANQYSIWRLDSALIDTDILFVKESNEGDYIGRKFDQFDIRPIDNFTSPNVFEVTGLDVANANDNYLVSFQVESDHDSFQERMDKFYFELTFVNDNKLVKRVKKTPKEHFRSDGQFEIIFSKEEIAEATRMMLKIGSVELNGATNKYFKVDLSL